MRSRRRSAISNASRRRRSRWRPAPPMPRCVARGLRAMLECDVEIVRDLDGVTAAGAAIAIKYLGVANATADTPEVRAYVGPQAAKRVILRFHPTRIVSWDHRKLGR